MKYLMHLDTDIFEKIKQNNKKVKIRLYDDKRKQIEIGDIIVFKNKFSNECVERTISKLLLFESFSSVFEVYSLKDLGFSSKELFIQRIYSIYSKKQEQEMGVLAIELKI